MATRRSRAPLPLQPDQVLELAAKYRSHSYRQLGKRLETFYRSYFERCLADRILTPEEKGTLLHLKTVLGLSDKVVQRIHNEVAEAVYRKTVDQAISDGRIDSEELAFLKSVQEELKLPKHVADRIYTEEATGLIARALSRAVSDRRLSPEEDQEIKAIARSLGAQMEFPEKTQTLLDRYRLYWLIENAELPVMKTDQKLLKNETCHFIVDSTWYEAQSQGKKPRPGGFVARSKIIRGDYHRSTEDVQRFAIEGMKTQDVGVLLLTNRRLLFKGKKKSVNIALKDIKDFHPFLNGVQFERKKRKNLFVAFDLGIDIFSLMLFRLLREA